MTNILCACSHPKILEIMDRLVNKQEDWQSTTAPDLDTTLKNLNRTSFDVVLLGAGFGPNEQTIIEQELANNSSSTKIVNHFGGGSGLLYTEVIMALKN